MKLVILGLTFSSSWGNGHATLWRGLVRALAKRGVEVVFYEKDVEYYAQNRDCTTIPGGRLVLYDEYADVRDALRRDLGEADAAILTSFCPDARAGAHDILDRCSGTSVFYDLDTPVTLAALSRGEAVAYLPGEGLGGFDLVLSYTGGRALDVLRHELGARRVHPLYGHADPSEHHRVAPVERFRADLSYIGTYASDRQARLAELLLEPASRRPDLWFVIAGAQYPSDFPWRPNIAFVRHLPPAEHAAFYSSSRLTLNITRADMAHNGFCPSGRLFEAAACGTPILSDDWEGLDAFFASGEEILIAHSTEDAMAALARSPRELAAIGEAARARVLAAHTSAHRADELIGLLESVGRASLDTSAAAEA